MSARTIENARIADVMIGYEDHGILTMNLTLEGEGWGVGFGGYALNAYDDVKRDRVGHAMLAEAVMRLLRTFEVNEVSKLKGLPCRVDTEGCGGRAHRIGHFLKDRWFSWQELADEYRVEVVR